MTSPLTITNGLFGGPLPHDVRELVRGLVGLGPGGPLLLDDAVVDLALVEKLGPLLGARVAEGRVTVPPERRAALMAEHYLCLAANLARAREVATLVDLTRDRPIPIVFLKGMAMLASTLGEGERSMGDVDVLVPPSRWEELCALVVRAGWKEDDIPGRGYTAGHDYVRAFTTGRGATIEIHRFVCEESLFSIDYDGLFARARRLPSGTLVPEDGDLFLTLAAHAAKHTFDLPLRSFVDGVFLLRRGQLRFDDLTARAKEWGMATVFRRWMTSLRWLDQEGVQEHKFADDRLPGGLGPQLGRWLWSRTTHENPWQRFLRLAWLIDGPWDWTRHVGTRLGLRVIDLVDDRLRRRAVPRRD
jgi:hypothetical protein